MSPESYLNCSWREVVCTINGYRNRVRDQSRVSWNQARIISYYAIIAHVKSGSIKSPQSLFKIDGDEADKDRQDFRVSMTNAEREEYFRVWGLKQKIKHENKKKLKEKRNAKSR